MGLADAFNKEDRVPVTFSVFYQMMKEATKSEFLMNAVRCKVPHVYIITLMFKRGDRTDDQRGVRESVAEVGES